MAGFYQVYIHPAVGDGGQVFREKVEKTLNLSLDWYRYDTNAWIIYTTKDAKVWYARLRKHIANGGRIFVCHVDMSDRMGWMPRTFWDWVKRVRESRGL